MIKAILFDVDGVILSPRDKYFSQRLREEGVGLAEDKVTPFFKNEYKKIVVGKADLKEELEKYLEVWGWNGTVDELLDYWFSYENKINRHVIDLAQEIRNKGIKCYLASDHSKYRTDDFWDNVGLNKYFDGVFSSGYMGFTKEDIGFFEIVVEKTNLIKSDVLFVDDDPENIKVAQNFGINVFYFNNKESSIDKLRTLVLDE